uniref:Protein tweety homolog n=1 Tax=Corethron hystrix TaxID=216773 RepID=A0A6U5E078_9STRA
MSDGGGYYAPPFKVGWLATLITNVLPRFGHSNDISLLASSNEDLQKDYTLGVLMFASIILIVCGLWAIVLIVLKCLGYRVGCAAGIPPIKPEEPHLHRNHALYKGIDAIPTRGSSSIVTGMTGFTGTVVTGMTDTPSMVAAYRDQEEWHDELVAVEGRNRRIKMAFLTFATVVVSFGVLLIVFSVVPVNRGMNSVYAGNEDLSSMIEKTTQEIGTFLDFSAQALPKTDQLLLDIVQFCPSSSGNSNIGKSVVALGSSLNAVTPIDDEITNLQFGLGEMRGTMATIDRTIEAFGWWVWVTSALLVLKVILAVVFIVGVSMAWRDRSDRTFTCAQSYVVLPIFSVFVMASVVCASLFSVLAVMDADFCTGTEYVPSPDVTVVNLLNRNEELKNGGLLYSTISYYAQGCAIRSPITFLDNFHGEVTDAIYSTQNFIDVVESSITSNIEQTCQKSEDAITQMVNAAKDAKGSLESLDWSINTIFSMMDCENVHPTYSQVVHEDICTAGMNGLGLGMLLFTFAALSGMAMISLRKAWYKVEEFPDNLAFK